MVIWITGLSGAGKSTVGNAVVRKLKEMGKPVVFLDGDGVRAAIDDRAVGHDRESRLINAFRICRFARLFEQQDLIVVVATMSLFHQVHEWNRENFGRYAEVFIKPDLAHLHRLDDKKIYTAAREGRMQNVVGHDLAPEEPLAPDLTLANDHSRTPAELAQIVLDKFFGPYGK